VRDTNLVSQDLVDQPRLSHGFTTINKPKHTEEPRTSISHPRVAERSNSSFKSPRELHDFDGDDLELDDFLATGDCRDKVKHSSRPKVVQLDDSDWLSIATTSPSPPKGVSKAPNPREDDWAAQLGEQVDGEYEPIRLANGKWACNHKCKDKTRLVGVSVGLRDS
jgi:ATP-dependent DNA helicase HFM1/MER3